MSRKKSRSGNTTDARLKSQGGREHVYGKPTAEDVRYKPRSPQ